MPSGTPRRRHRRGGGDLILIGLGAIAVVTVLGVVAFFL